MYVSSLFPWLLDFHAIQFSGSSGWFLFLNWLLSFFWLCEEVKRIYLHLHLECLKSKHFNTLIHQNSYWDKNMCLTFFGESPWLAKMSSDVRGSLRMGVVLGRGRFYLSSDVGVRGSRF